MLLVKVSYKSVFLVTLVLLIHQISYPTDGCDQRSIGLQDTKNNATVFFFISPFGETDVLEIDLKGCDNVTAVRYSVRLYLPKENYRQRRSHVKFCPITGTSLVIINETMDGVYFGWNNITLMWNAGSQNVSLTLNNRQQLLPTNAVGSSWSVDCRGFRCHGYNGLRIQEVPDTALSRFPLVFVSDAPITMYFASIFFTLRLLLVANGSSMHLCYDNDSAQVKSSRHGCDEETMSYQNGTSNISNTSNTFNMTLDMFSNEETVNYGIFTYVNLQLSSPYRYTYFFVCSFDTVENGTVYEKKNYNHFSDSEEHLLLSKVILIIAIILSVAITTVFHYLYKKYKNEQQRMTSTWGMVIPSDDHSQYLNATPFPQTGAQEDIYDTRVIENEAAGYETNEGDGYETNLTENGR